MRHRISQRSRGSKYACRRVARFHKKLNASVLQDASSPEEEDQSGREDNRSKKVTLGEYKNGAIKEETVKYKYTSKMLEDAEQKLASTTHKFERINFTGSGAKLGHTVIVDISGKYLGGENAGMPIPGTTASMFELELKVWG